MTHFEQERPSMFRKFTKTLTLSLAMLCLVSGLALAQAGGAGGTGASGSPGGSGGMGSGPGNLGMVPSNPGQSSPGDTMGRSGVPGSPSGVPDTTNPSMRGNEPPGTFTTPETSRDRELRQQGEAPRTEPGTDSSRRSGLETPGGTSTSIPDSSGTNRTRSR
jgi:hypothetical protein